MSIAQIKALNPRDWMTFNRLACMASLALATAAYVPLLAQYAAQLWSTPGYRLAPVILILGALSARRRAGDLKPVETGRWPAALAGGLAAATLAWAVAVNSPELAAASLAILGMAVALRWGGVPAARVMVGPWILACLVLRLPGAIDLACFQSIARFSVAAAHRVLDTLGVLHDLDGLSLVIPTARLGFGAAHYNLFSPWSAVAVVLAVCCWLQRSWIDSLLMLVAGCGWFVLSDVVRIVATVLLSGVLQTPMTVGIGAVVLDYVALVLMLSLIVSTDHVGMLFGKAMRLARPERRARTTKAVVLPGTTVKVTGVTMDADGQLVKVVSEYADESAKPSTWPPEPIAIEAARPAMRADWPLLATVFGLLCIAQVLWLPSASDAATSRKSISLAAMQVQMPAEFAGWRLEQSAAREVAAEGGSDQRESIDARPGPLVSWRYQRNDLKFELSIRPRNRLGQDAVEAWRDRGWRLEPPQKATDQDLPATPAIACREVRLSKPYQPGYVCVWESERDAHGLEVQGLLHAFHALNPQELAAGRELFYRVAAKLERETMPDEGTEPGERPQP
jgi:hypothetical protein